MKKNKNLLWYSVIVLTIILVDRLTKIWALQLSSTKIINEYLSFSLLFNRGINWGMFNYANPVLFLCINACIAAIIALLIWHTIYSWRAGESIMSYLIILAGAVSNYFDRIWHGGVIDFIVLSWQNWNWPAFNIADAAILIGISLVLIRGMKK